MVTENFSFQLIHDVSGNDGLLQLQEKTWGKDTVMGTPHLIAAIRNGGMIIGAFHNNKLIGFCFGFPGFKHGETFLVSHMMAVMPEYRNAGVGEKLKWQQKQWAKGYGYKKIVWTYDSLESRNGYLNLHKLQAKVRTYINDYYEEMNDAINQGLPSDRFQVEWDLTASDEEEQPAFSKTDNVPKILDWQGEGAGAEVVPVVNQPMDGEKMYLAAVPKNIHEMKTAHPQRAREWRFAHRTVFTDLFSIGYTVVDLFLTEEECPVNYYVVVKN